jgi:cell division protein FtsB
LTTRAAILACVVSALALLLAIPLKTYLGQHDQIDSLQQTQALQQKRIDALQKSVKQYNDPAYIVSQARARLHLIAPGETDYVVVPGAKKPAPPAVKAAPAVVVPGTSADPWWTRLWASAAQADHK